MTTQNDKPKRWRPQIRLSSLMLVTLLLALIFAWVAERWRADRLDRELQRVQMRDASLRSLMSAMEMQIDSERKMRLWREIERLRDPQLPATPN